jgi:hypothetical protein
LTTTVTTLIDERYPELARDLEFPIIELLRVSRALCGDADKSIVLIAIAIRTVEHADFRSFRMADLDGLEGDPPSLGTNARSLSGWLGIPRETSRRRVLELIDAGLVVRRGRTVVLSARGMTHLAPFRRSVLKLAARYHELVSSISPARSSSASTRDGRAAPE